MTALYFYQNPRLLIIALLTIVFAGMGAYWLMPRIEDPILRKRVGVVTTVFPGATAAQMEKLIAIPVEQRLESVKEVATLKSNCRANIANVVVELKDTVRDVDSAWSAIRDEIGNLHESLPSGSEKPRLEVFPLKAYATIIAIQSDRLDSSGLHQLASELKSRIHTLTGTEQVELVGDVGLEIGVNISPGKLVEHGLTVGRLSYEVSRTLAGESIGILDQKDVRLQFTLDELDGPVERIRNFKLVDANGQSVKLGEMADVRLQPQRETQEKCLVNGQPSIVLAAMVSDENRVDQWDDRLQQELADFRTEYPDIEIQEVFSQRNHIDQRMRRLFRNLLLSGISVILVVLLLMGWKSMLVVVVALPLVVLIVLTGMKLLGVPIHQMSVTGIIVALGLLIDNAIVVVEDIRKRIVQGIQPYSAIRMSIHHLRYPLLGATLTTALSFLPIALLPGAAGEFVGAIAITVILAVVASYFVATLILPALIGNIGVNPRQHGFFEYGVSYEPLSNFYLRTLYYILQRPWVGIVLGVFLPGIGFLAWMHLPVQFFPASDRPQIEIEVELANGSSFQALETTVDQVQKLIEKDERVTGQCWFLGRSAPTFFYNVVARRKNSPYYAQAFIDLDPSHSLKLEQVVSELQSSLDQVDSGRVTVRLLEQGPPFDSPIEIRVTGPDYQQLVSIGNQLRGILADTNGVIQTRSDLAESIFGHQFVPDSESLADSPFSTGEVASSLRSAIHGVDAGDLITGDEVFPVKVRVEMGPDDILPDVLQSLPITEQPQESVRDAPPPQYNVGMFGRFEFQPKPAAILRLNGERVNEIKAYLRVGQLPSAALDEFKTRLDRRQVALPSGYSIEYGGEDEERSTAVGNLIAYAPVFLLLILFLIVAIFGAFQAGLYIALVGGLTVGLVPLALATFGFPFGFMAIVGAMGLIGIAINDSIVVMASLYELDEDEQTDPIEVANAVLDNTRHIIATTLTTIAGFLPLVMGGGRFWPPMAIALAGGILGATFLAVYFVPSMFILFKQTFTWNDDLDSESNNRDILERS